MTEHAVHVHVDEAGHDPQARHRPVLGARSDFDDVIAVDDEATRRKDAVRQDEGGAVEDQHGQSARCNAER